MDKEMTNDLLINDNNTATQFLLLHKPSSQWGTDKEGIHCKKVCIAVVRVLFYSKLEFWIKEKVVELLSLVL